MVSNYNIITGKYLFRQFCMHSSFFYVYRVHFVGVWLINLLCRNWLAVKYKIMQLSALKHWTLQWSLETCIEFIAVKGCTIFTPGTPLALWFPEDSGTQNIESEREGRWMEHFYWLMDYLILNTWETHLIQGEEKYDQFNLYKAFAN